MTPTDPGAVLLIAAGLGRFVSDDWRCEMKCPMCLENEATTYGNPDYRSNTSIPCCADCLELLLKLNQYQHKHTGGKFIKGNEDKINRAYEALGEIYEADYEARKKRYGNYI